MKSFEWFYTTNGVAPPFENNKIVNKTISRAFRFTITYTSQYNVFWPLPWLVFCHLLLFFVYVFSSWCIIIVRPDWVNDIVSHRMWTLDVWLFDNYFELVCLQYSNTIFCSTSRYFEQCATGLKSGVSCRTRKRNKAFSSFSFKSKTNICIVLKQNRV